MTRTITITPTWREAAHIIAAALENGTGEGREAARKELARMAEILDQINSDEPERPTLWDVVAWQEDRTPYGLAFASEEEANEYAKSLKAHGYETEAYPAHSAVTVQEALEAIAEHYGDARLTQNPEAKA